MCDPEYLAREHVVSGFCSLMLEEHSCWTWGGVVTFPRYLASPRTHTGWLLDTAFRKIYLYFQIGNRLTQHYRMIHYLNLNLEKYFHHKFFL